MHKHKCHVKRVLRILDSLDKGLYLIEGRVREDTPIYGSDNRPRYHIRLGLLFSNFEMVFAGTEESLSLDLLLNGAKVLGRSDGDGALLEDQVGDLVLEAAVLSDKRHGEETVEKRECERRWRRERKEREEDRRSKVLGTRMDQLVVLSEKWDKAERMRRFLGELEDRRGVETEESKVEDLSRLIGWMRGGIDVIDPFVQSWDSFSLRDAPRTVWELSALIRRDGEQDRKWDEEYDAEPPIPE